MVAVPGVSAGLLDPRAGIVCNDQAPMRGRAHGCHAEHQHRVRAPRLHHVALQGGHKPDYDAATDDGDVFIRSVYFKDPNGTQLELASWTRVLDDTDVSHAPARALRPTVDA
jgi:hypothetical protein